MLKPQFSDGAYTKVGEPAGTWTRRRRRPRSSSSTRPTRTSTPSVTPNDDNANAVIADLQKDKIPAKTFPTTGQDASPVGLQNILKGYQCGTVYKPIYAEAQAAAALAIYLRAGQTPPPTLVNATTKDTTIGADVQSVYTTPMWVTTKNMAERS